MRQENLEKIHSFWAKSLGCKPEIMENPRSDIFIRRETTEHNKDLDETEIDIFIRNDKTILSCDSKALHRVQKLEKHLSDLEISRSSLEKKGLGIQKILGPAFLSFTDSKSYQSTESSNCRQLTASDNEALEELKSKADNKEIENSISGYKISQDHLFGKFERGELVAVSSYGKWGDEIAFLVVFVLENQRGEGFGQQVVSEAVENALDQNLIPCYRTVEDWDSSVNLAKSLGFEKYAQTYRLKLKKE